MELIRGGRSKEQPKPKVTSGVLSDGTTWERVPRCTVTKDVLARYIAIVTEAAEAAINVGASDPVEEAARALAAGFGAAMVSHGRQRHEEGYALGETESKAYLALLGVDDEETAE